MLPSVSFPPTRGRIGRLRIERSGVHVLHNPRTMPKWFSQTNKASFHQFGVFSIQAVRRARLKRLSLRQRATRSSAWFRDLPGRMSKRMSQATQAPTSTSESAVYDRYASAAHAVERQLCCPVEYQTEYLNVIPPEVIQRDY